MSQYSIAIRVRKLFAVGKFGLTSVSVDKGPWLGAWAFSPWGIWFLSSRFHVARVA